MLLAVRHLGVRLPLIANPSIVGGGVVGESKSAVLGLVGAQASSWFAPHIDFERGRDSPEGACRRALQAASDAGLGLPLVAKPDLGCRGAGVRPVRNEAELAAYMAAFPLGERLVLQQLVDLEGEAGVFWVHEPGAARGRIVSLTLKYFPHVIGDGVSTVEQLIRRDPRAGQLSHLYLHRHAERLHEVLGEGQALRLAFAGSHSRGAIFRDGTHLVTREMEARFEAIARSLPEFHFGRFDVRFERFADVQQGHGFTIVEVNGAGAESTHIWDRRTTLLQAWGALMRQYRWLFEIGHANRARGFKPMKWTQFLHDYRREKQLTPQYPATD